ncbi:hypothetical protein [Bartonella rattaustraliani]|uniref:hypothetical protein n=1 Tax=Bartonella rattaustraliani TaxID=481139 RepID=UPI000300024E|nr:hypothetical protein [Bartonella rattaustraliani]
MVKIFKDYTINLLVASTFFLSQAVNAHANYTSPTKEIVDSVITQVESAASTAMNTAAYYIPTLNHGAEKGATAEGKVVKVVEPFTIGMGFLFFGFAIKFVVDLVSGIVNIFK